MKKVKLRRLGFIEKAATSFFRAEDGLTVHWRLEEAVGLFLKPTN
jgi:hypothetical protein